MAACRSNHVGALFPDYRNFPAVMHTRTLKENLELLYGIFRESPHIPDWEEMDGQDLPEPYRSLLVHEAHMTVTMEKFYGSPVVLTVVETSRRENLYARKILLLTRQTGKVVQFGIMRFNFDYCSEAVRDEILSESTPLGRILIKHNLLRRIDLHALLKMRTDRELRRLLEISEARDVYGRIATIFCDERPAVELLEIAAPVD